MAEYFGTKVEDIFNSMESRFLPEGASGVDASIGYRISGEGGGCWRLTIKGGSMKIETVPENSNGCAVTLCADAETFVGVTLGMLDAAEAFSSGRVKVEGDITILGNVLPKVFVPFSPVVKASDIVESYPGRFRAEQAVDVSLMVGYDLSGEGGGQWTLVIEDGACSVQEGIDSGCSVILKMSAEVFVDLNMGRLDGAEAFSSGRVVIEGDMAAAGATAKYFYPYESGGAAKEELISLKCMPTIRQRYATGPLMGMWFSGLAEKKFIASRCPVCGRTQVPPREVCAMCRVRCEELVEVGPNATVILVDTVYYASPDPLTGAIRKTPYAALFMVMDNSSDTESFSHELNPADIDRIKPGMRVRPVWAEVRTGCYKDLKYFEIDD